MNQELNSAIRRKCWRVVSEGRVRLFGRKDGKYLIYMPKDFAENSVFPFKSRESILVKIGFKSGDDKLHIERWDETEKST
jgi:hypothetical protein